MEIHLLKPSFAVRKKIIKKSTFLLGSVSNEHSSIHVQNGCPFSVNLQTCPGLQCLLAQGSRTEEKYIYFKAMIIFFKFMLQFEL